MLVAGLMPGRKGAENLLQIMEKHILNLLGTDKLKQWIKRSDALIFDSGKSNNLIANRVVMIFLFLFLTLSRERISSSYINLESYRTLSRHIPQYESDDLSINLSSFLDLARNRPEISHSLILNINFYDFIKRLNIFDSLDLKFLISRLKKLKEEFDASGNLFELRQNFPGNTLRFWMEKLNLRLDFLCLR